MQTDPAKDIRTRFDARKACVLQEPRKTFHGNETAKRIGNVRINVRTAVQEDAPKGAHGIEISEVEAPQKTICWKKEIQCGELPAGSNHAFDFFDRRTEIGKIAQSVADEDTVEACVGERES